MNNSGAQQNKQVAVKDRKMQMRVVGSSTKTNNYMGGTNQNTPHTNNIFVDQPRVAGIGHGFGTQRPSSRDGRLQQAQNNPKNRQIQGTKFSGNSLNATQTT